MYPSVVQFSGSDHRPAEEVSSRAVSACPSVDPILSGKRVVIVEDAGVTQLHLKTMLLRMEMVPVGMASNGPAGVLMVLELKPDIVLMDINMPGEFDGLEATRRILAEFPTCIIMMTAYEEFKSDAMALGACGYLIKPVDSGTFIPTICELYRDYQNHGPGPHDLIH